jgi:hypothetical protein
MGTRQQQIHRQTMRMITQPMHFSLTLTLTSLSIYLAIDHSYVFIDNTPCRLSRHL